MRLKRWIWNILLDGKEHWFKEDTETYDGNGIRYVQMMFEDGGEIMLLEHDKCSFDDDFMKSGWYVRKCHIESEPVVMLPKELFEI